MYCIISPIYSGNIHKRFNCIHIRIEIFKYWLSGLNCHFLILLFMKNKQVHICMFLYQYLCLSIAVFYVYLLLHTHTLVEFLFILYSFIFLLFPLCIYFYLAHKMCTGFFLLHILYIRMLWHIYNIYILHGILQTPAMPF